VGECTSGQVTSPKLQLLPLASEEVDGLRLPPAPLGTGKGSFWLMVLLAMEPVEILLSSCLPPGKTSVVVPNLTVLATLLVREEFDILRSIRGYGAEGADGVGIGVASLFPKKLNEGAKLPELLVPEMRLLADNRTLFG